MKRKLNPEFWLGQLFTLIATIVGVYLAANSGFDKAIEFENLQHQRDSYHVQQSLLKEMQVNLKQVEEWIDEFDRNPQHNNMDMYPDKYQLDTFLWQTTQEGSAIFEMPYSFVSGVSDFYGRAEYLRTQLISGNPFEAPKASAQLRELIDETNTHLVDQLQRHISNQRNDLLASGLL